MKKINSAEIARQAGVSRSTVSRVVNSYSNVPSDTRDRVMKVINENEYYPLLCGQLLAGKRTGTIGFFWISDSPIANDIQSSSFFVHVTEAATEMGYLVLACILKNLSDKDNIEHVKKIYMQERIDGGIFIGIDNHEPLIDELVSKNKIAGVFDYHRPECAEPNRISVNFETSTGIKAIDYAVSMGHTKIAILDGNPERYSCLTRHEGFLAGLEKHNIPIRKEWIANADITEEHGYKAALDFLSNAQELPTCICCQNDSVAFGAYKALREKGISIPGQISIIGIDGHFRGQLMNPPLTTFEFNFKKFFRSLVTRTISAIEGKDGYDTTEFIDSVLVERGSVLDLRK
ncbi:MAG: LacI family transcriptional regulator [Clostridiales bacterium]|jgi:LacI family transcriptional regulator|nr:LacI family transcriptional regulator [Clostridiales bacterium]MDR2751204.1 LacI family transcriptional regulator [Clostridiales bacterium]